MPQVHARHGIKLGCVLRAALVQAIAVCWLSVLRVVEQRAAKAGVADRLWLGFLRTLPEPCMRLFSPK